MNQEDILIDQLQTLLDKQEYFFRQLTWQANNPEDLRQLCRHYNGFIREKAVILLGIMKMSRAIPDIVERLNDWVPQVRLAAKRSLAALLTEQNAESIVSCLPEIHRLLSCGRDNHLNSINQVVSFLLQQQNQVYLTNAITDKQPDVARLALQLVIEHHLLPCEEIMTKGLSHHAILVRLAAAKLFLAYPDSVSWQHLMTALHDSFAPIRLLVIEYLNQHPSISLEGTEIETLLFDNHQRIRGWAMAQLRSVNIDVLVYYYQTLQKKTESAQKINCALWAMGFIPHPDVISIVHPFLQHAFPTVRRAALQVSVRVLTDSAKALLLNSMMDDSPTVTKEVVRLFIKHRLALSLTELQQLAGETKQIHQQKACHQLANCLNKWDRLVFLLQQVLLHQDTNAVDLLCHWYEKFNQSGTQPTTRQIESVTSLLNSPMMRDNIKCYSGLCDITAFFAASNC